MKKLMTLAAVVAACAPAFTAEVTSSNTVGYQKVNISSGMTMIGMPFVAVGGQNGVDIQEIVPGNTLTKGGVSAIRVWNGSDYSAYYYYSDAADGGIYDGDNCLGPGWGDKDQEVVEVPIPSGQGFWIQSNSAEVITTKGEVSEVVTVPIIAGLTMVCNPQPVDIDIQQIVPANTLTKGGVSAIRVWDGSAYTSYYYYSEAADGGIYDGDDCLGPGWGDKDQEVVSVTIHAGEAVWVQSNSAETLSFPNALSHLSN